MMGDDDNVVPFMSDELSWVMTLGEAMIVEGDVVGLSPLSEEAMMMGEDRKSG